MCNEASEDISKKFGEFELGHFAGRHCKFAMVNVTKAANVAVNFYVIWRIGDDEVGLSAHHQRRVNGLATPP